MNEINSPDAIYEKALDQEKQKNYKDAFLLYQQATDLGHIKARTNLASFFLQGTGGTKKDSKKAYELLYLSALAGHARAQYNIASMLKYGDGCTSCKPSALYWYEEAAKQEHPKKQDAIRNSKVLREAGISPKAPMVETTLITESKDDKKNKNIESKINQSNEDIKLTTEISAAKDIIKDTKDLRIIPHTDLTFISELGSGSFGVVYKGKWRGIPVAIKQLKVENLSDSAMQEFHDEVTVMSKLDFPTIVRFYGVSLDNVPSLVMEYYPMGSLFDYMHKSGHFLSDSNLYSVGINVASGLNYLHEKGILHRDLRSPNVLLSSSGGYEIQALIADFGLAKIRAHSKTMLDVNSKMLGLINWLAPELLLPGNKHTTATDVYMYGTLLWEMVQHEIPFDGINDFNVILSQMKARTIENITDSPYCDEFFRKMIWACWDLVPENRPTMKTVLEKMDAPQNDSSSSESSSENNSLSSIQCMYQEKPDQSNLEETKMPPMQCINGYFYFNSPSHLLSNVGIFETSNVEINTNVEISHNVEEIQNLSSKTHANK